MTDPIAEAWAALHDKLTSLVLAVVAYGGKGEEAIAAHGAAKAAADRLALAGYDEAYGLAHGMGGSQADWDALHARLEGKETTT